MNYVEHGAQTSETFVARLSNEIRLHIFRFDILKHLTWAKT